MDDYCVVIGASNLDISGHADYELITGDSTLGRVRTNAGGVGRNIACNVSKLGIKTCFLSALGDDGFAKIVKDQTQNDNLRLIARTSRRFPTGVYLFIENSEGEMINAVNDMAINGEIDIPFLDNHRTLIEQAPLVVVDTNIPAQSIGHILEMNSNVVVDPVSTKKALKLIPYLDRIRIIKPNLIELEALSGCGEITDKESLYAAMSVLLAAGVREVVVSLGRHGAAYASAREWFIIQSPPMENITNTTGAGDAFVAGLACSLLRKTTPQEMVKSAIACAMLTIQSETTIAMDLTKERIEEIKHESVFRYLS